MHTCTHDYMSMYIFSHVIPEICRHKHSLPFAGAGACTETSNQVWVCCVHTRVVSKPNETVGIVVTDNLLITAEGALKISDFGLATLLGVKARVIG